MVSKVGGITVGTLTGGLPGYVSRGSGRQRTGALTGALAGAGTGATIGSVIPGVGTAIGAGVGGLIGAVGGFLSGKKNKNKQLSTLSPEQRAYQTQLFQMLQGMSQPGGAYSQANKYYSDILGGDRGSFDRFSQPYINQYNQQTLPRLLENFAAIGGPMGGGIGNSSGFGQAVSGSASQFQSNLAGMYENLRAQVAQQTMDRYNQLANLAYGRNTVENTYQPGNAGFGPEALSRILQGAGQGWGQQGGYNWMQGDNPNQGINDTWGPNAGIGTYNKYTGVQGGY